MKEIFLSKYFVVKRKITQVSKPGKEESLNSRDKNFAESMKKLNSTDQILRTNLYSTNKM